jgi:hypothetical protein
LFESEAKVWWVFNHRAFLEAMCIGNILREEAKLEGGEELLLKDPLFLRAKADIGEYYFVLRSWVLERDANYETAKMIEIMQLMSEGEHGSAVALTRVSVLSTYLPEAQISPQISTT